MEYRLRHERLLRRSVRRYTPKDDQDFLRRGFEESHSAVAAIVRPWVGSINTRLSSGKLGGYPKTQHRRTVGL